MSLAGFWELKTQPDAVLTDSAAIDWDGRVQVLSWHISAQLRCRRASHHPAGEEDRGGGLPARLPATFHLPAPALEEKTNKQQKDRGFLLSFTFLCEQFMDCFLTAEQLFINQGEMKDKQNEKEKKNQIANHSNSE